MLKWREIPWNQGASAPTKLKSPRGWAERRKMIRKTESGRELQGREKSETDGEWGNFTRDSQTCIFICVLRNGLRRKRSTYENCTRAGATTGWSHGGHWPWAAGPRLHTQAVLPTVRFLFRDMDNSTVFSKWSFKILFSFFLFFLKILFIYFWREGKWGRKRGREISMCGCLSCVPYWGPGLQPRHVPWLEIKPVTLCFTSLHSIHWATPARVQNIIFNDFYKLWKAI